MRRSSRLTDVELDVPSIWSRRYQAVRLPKQDGGLMSRRALMPFAMAAALLAIAGSSAFAQGRPASDLARMAETPQLGE